jgi:hypothetical protein
MTFEECDLQYPSTRDVNEKLNEQFIENLRFLRLARNQSSAETTKSGSIPSKKNGKKRSRTSSFLHAINPINVMTPRLRIDHRHQDPQGE